MLKTRSDKYKKSVTKSDKKESYSVKEAVEFAQKSSYSKFPGSLDLVVNLNIDPTKNDQRINVITSLPFQTGKAKRILVLCAPDSQAEAKKAGADEVMGVEGIAKIEGGYLDFDILIATPDMMVELAKIAKILGPKGLMPNPKNNTVTTSLATAIGSHKKGQLSLKMKEAPMIQTQVGKVDQDPSEVSQNIQHVIEIIRANKPTKVKGILIKSVFLAPTMGPSFKLSI
ncbi:50S ribosomal protein L1 [candidate division WWE3 bacterium RIFCSPLOWO2_01_FULL_42_11]|uniref:Ribosomal protein n=1 Tax=candidate division WWE3 bacterium RIFCSPLOWO2_01_FULL_42_11 TaxID=1802627 RepID=A0A1F4VPU2_UNCKA|nr:MAG: 50S ribosomal protein L1 [candidate division WWE3 bacterium RIFCSPLOWO2_01_FULL_42_11]